MLLASTNDPFRVSPVVRGTPAWSIGEPPEDGKIWVYFRGSYVLCWPHLSLCVQGKVRLGLELQSSRILGYTM